MTYKFDIKELAEKFPPRNALTNEQPPEKKGGVELVTLFISFVALWISWNGQDYIEATYANNQKIIIYSEKDKEQDHINRIAAIGDNKRILQIDILFPKGFNQKKEYIDSRGMYVNDPKTFDKLAEFIPKGLNEGYYSVSIPVNLFIRYAADGNAYSDNSVYIMKFYFRLSKKADSDDYSLKPRETSFVFASRKPTSLKYKIATLFNGEDEAFDIDKMFEKKVYWHSFGSVGEL